MIKHALTISLIIIAVHVCCLDGMILNKPAEWIGRILDDHNLSVLRKPLYECVMCMGGIYTIVLYPALYGISLEIIPAVPIVIGINSILSHFLTHLQ